MTLHVIHEIHSAYSEFYNINVAFGNHICITCFFIRDPFIESHIFDGGWSTVATALSFERALEIKNEIY